MLKYFLEERLTARSTTDVRELEPDPFPYTFYVDYLNTPTVQAAIGAYVNFSESNNAVSLDFANTGDDDRESSTVEDIRMLLHQGVTVMLYAGDADYNCNWLGGEVVANEVGQSGFATAGYANISTSDKVVHGQVKQSGAFSFARIYESGHEVPFVCVLNRSDPFEANVGQYQPLVSLEIFKRAIRGLDIASGTMHARNGYKTMGPATSTYREGNSTIQFSVVNDTATYNTTTNEPNLPLKLMKHGKPNHSGTVFKPVAQ